ERAAAAGGGRHGIRNLDRGPARAVGPLERCGARRRLARCRRPRAAAASEPRRHPRGWTGDHARPRTPRLGVVHRRGPADARRDAPRPRLAAGARERPRRRHRAALRPGRGRSRAATPVAAV
ncbi:MAG: hypothetical protein AVDCRST_MAG40-3448, partial [uncultured Gemmatimonadaceae bacterium]